MPVYEYRCMNCEENFEKLQNFSDSGKDVKCPCCGEMSSKKLFSVFGSTSSSQNCFPNATGGST